MKRISVVVLSVGLLLILSSSCQEENGTYNHPEGDASSTMVDMPQHVDPVDPPAAPANGAATDASGGYVGRNALPAAAPLGTSSSAAGAAPAGANGATGAVAPSGSTK